MKTYKQQDTQDRILEITGTTSDIEEALDQWMNEREAMGEFYEKMQLYEELWKKTARVLDDAFAVIALCEHDAGMFIRERTRARIQKLRDSFNKLMENGK